MSDGRENEGRTVQREVVEGNVVPEKCGIGHRRDHGSEAQRQVAPIVEEYDQAEMDRHTPGAVGTP